MVLGTDIVCFNFAAEQKVEKLTGQDSSGDEDSDDDDDDGRRPEGSADNGLSKDMGNMTFDDKVSLFTSPLETDTSEELIMSILTVKLKKSTEAISCTSFRPHGVPCFFYVQTWEMKMESEKSHGQASHLLSPEKRTILNKCCCGLLFLPHL